MAENSPPSRLDDGSTSKKPVSLLENRPGRKKTASIDLHEISGLVRAALQGGFADSRILEVHGQRMIDGAFTPGGRANVQRKDLDQALELAGTLDLELPATSLCRDLFDKLIEAGHGDLDHSALIKAIDPDA